MKKLIRWLAVFLFGAGLHERAISETSKQLADEFKLYSDLSKLPMDIGVWLGKNKDEVLSVLNGIEFMEEREQGNWLPKTNEDDKNYEWRRLIFMITWINSYNASISRPARISFNAKSGKIWYVHLPLKKVSRMPGIGQIKADDTFQTCVAKLGKPVSDVQTAPVIREASWQVNGTTFRITYYSEAFSDVHQVFSAGEIDMVLAYRKDLAPPGFDEKPKVYDPAKGW